MNHYVYIVTNLMNGKKYIGKRSCKCKIEDDKYMGSGYLLAKAKEKYGIENFEKKILLVCETEEEAYEEEKKAIELVKAWENPMYYNLVPGGHGFCSRYIKGENNPFYGKKHTEETKERIKFKLKGKMCGEKNPNYGKKMSMEQKIKISKSRKGKYAGIYHPNIKPVICLNTGKVYDYIKQASKQYNISSSLIIECCKGNICSAGFDKSMNEPLVWMYLNDYKQTANTNVNYVLIKGLNSKAKRPKKVICLNDLQVFDSLGDASKNYNTNISGICECCQGVQNVGGKHPITKEPLVWKYLEDYEKMTKQEIYEALCNGINFKKGKNNPNSSQVVCVDTMEVFDYIKQAGKKYNIHPTNISRVCRGLGKTAGKLRWMYLEDYENKYGKINKEIV